MTAALIDQYRDIAARGENFRGLSICQYADEIGALLRKHDAVTILDYGSGRGDQWEMPVELHRKWRLPKPTVYDPAFATHDVPPRGVFDAVLCSDVLEHVPKQEVDAFIDTLIGYASKMVWASVCCRPAKKRFADGTNMHVTVESVDWWSARIAAREPSVPFYLIETP